MVNLRPELNDSAALSIILQEGIHAKQIGNEFILPPNTDFSSIDLATFSTLGRLLLCAGDDNESLAIDEKLVISFDPSSSSVCLKLEFFYYATPDNFALQIDDLKSIMALAQEEMQEHEQGSLLGALRKEPSNTETAIANASSTIRKALPNRRIPGTTRFKINGEDAGVICHKIASPRIEVIESMEMKIEAIVVDVSTDRRQLQFVHGKKMSASFDINKMTNEAADALKVSVAGQKARLGIRRTAFSDNTYEDEVVSVHLL